MQMRAFLCRKRFSLLQRLNDAIQSRQQVFRPDALWLRRRVCCDSLTPGLSFHISSGEGPPQWRPLPAPAGPSDLLPQQALLRSWTCKTLPRLKAENPLIQPQFRRELLGPALAYGNLYHTSSILLCDEMSD